MVTSDFYAKGFVAYTIYLAIKQHFTNEKYDFFEYGGAVRASRESYNKRNDKYFFAKLATKMKPNEIIDFFVANFIMSGNKTWVGDMFKDDAHDKYVEWQKRNAKLQSTFKTEVQELFDTASDNSVDILDFFVVKDNQHPEVLVWLLQGRLSIETFIIMNRIINFLPKIDSNLDDEYVWSKVYKKCLKYDPFIDVDMKYFKKTFNSIFQVWKKRTI